MWIAFSLTYKCYSFNQTEKKLELDLLVFFQTDMNLQICIEAFFKQVIHCSGYFFFTSMRIADKFNLTDSSVCMTYNATCI